MLAPGMPQVTCQEPVCCDLCATIPGVAEELKSFLTSQDRTPQIPSTPRLTDNSSAE